MTLFLHVSYSLGVSHFIIYALFTEAVFKLLSFSSLTWITDPKVAL